MWLIKQLDLTKLTCFLKKQILTKLKPRLKLKWLFLTLFYQVWEDATEDFLYQELSQGKCWGASRMPVLKKRNVGSSRPTML